MYFVQCPQCGAVVEIPVEFMEKKRKDYWNAAVCEECDSSFDFENATVEFMPDAERVH